MKGNGIISQATSFIEVWNDLAFDQNLHVSHSCLYFQLHKSCIKAKHRSLIRSLNYSILHHSYVIQFLVIYFDRTLFCNSKLIKVAFYIFKGNSILYCPKKVYSLFWELILRKAEEVSIHGLY